MGPVKYTERARKHFQQPEGGMVTRPHWPPFRGLWLAKKNNQILFGLAQTLHIDNITFLLQRKQEICACSKKSNSFIIPCCTYYRNRFWSFFSSNSCAQCIFTSLSGWQGETVWDSLLLKAKVLGLTSVRKSNGWSCVSTSALSYF